MYHVLNLHSGQDPYEQSSLSANVQNPIPILSHVLNMNSDLDSDKQQTMLASLLNIDSLQAVHPVRSSIYK